MSSRTLSKGANIGLEEVFDGTNPRLVVVIETTATADSVAPDVSVVVLGEDGKVRSNDDFIFYNQPAGADGAVALLSLENDDGGPANHARRDAIKIELDRMPDTVHRIVIAASTDNASTVTFGDVTAVRMWVARAVEPAKPIITYEISNLGDERALIFGEIYRRGDAWKVRAVGQGYHEGLAALATAFGIEVDDAAVVAAEVSSQKTSSPAEHQLGTDPAAPGVDSGGRPPQSGKVAMTRRRKPARLPADWAQRTSPYLPVAEAEPWRRARLFPTTGIKTTTEQEIRSASVLLSVMDVVREFGRAIVSLAGGPGGRIETYTEVRFSQGSQNLRPDGLIRVTRGSKIWQALVEVKTGKAALDQAQVEAYLGVARAKGIDAIVTISAELMSSSDELPVTVDARKYKGIAVRHLSWEEIITEAAIVHRHTGIDDPTRARIIDEFLTYASDAQSGMATFDDMGTHWVKVREAVKVRTIGANDAGALAVCRRFDQLTRHIALQLSALSGQRVLSVVPADHPDAVSRAKQLADSGELFGSLRVSGAAGPIVLNANLCSERIGCSLTTFAPRTGRPASKINWLLRQLVDVPDKTRITAHHAGSRTETTSALLEAARKDPSVLIPPSGKDIREFSVTLEVSMGSKRAGSEGGFVASMVKLTNTFYHDVAGVLRNGRDG
ncbi:TerD family protein [Mycolicibacterium sp. 018/SC-01/001]|uniref:TerD family protein n=1 Tax=Mycolicibacterium sp. 018/SC-01/001 TaxID=2592069 RepID=UPI00117F9E20|nr:TerD family protein [Mycolicibacterium sp. 018/SC-01/001]TRW86215.1 TerD family protein [Mycolicibacterium sp. 018/SC-01/001]